MSSFSILNKRIVSITLRIIVLSYAEYVIKYHRSLFWGSCMENEMQHLENEKLSVPFPCQVRPKLDLCHGSSIDGLVFIRPILFKITKPTTTSCLWEPQWWALHQTTVQRVRCLRREEALRAQFVIQSRYWGINALVHNDELQGLRDLCWNIWCEYENHP